LALKCLGEKARQEHQQFARLAVFAPRKFDSVGISCSRLRDREGKAGVFRGFRERLAV
jgi:hypothetical protein